MIKLHSLRAAKFKQLDDVSLRFPERGSVLVQGLNEAGKSTLFESVYFALFGKALVTEDNSGRMDDLIHYQSPRALVDLAFTTDQATFHVTRTLNRGKTNTAVLDVAYAGGKRETVTNLTAVNRRIVQELGLDGEALLNSCFVEQKKLEKIESMTAQQRRDTLLRLLNLERLSALEAQYKPSPAADYQLQQLRDRLRLAELQRELPRIAARLEAVQAELRLLEGVRLTRRIRELDAVQAAEAEAQSGLQAQAGEHSAQLAEVEYLEQTRELARACGEALVAIEQDRQDLDHLARELASLQAQAAELPALQADTRRLEDLAATLGEVERRGRSLDEQRRELERLAEASQRVTQLQASLRERQSSLAIIEGELASVQASLAGAEAADQQARQADLLRAWLQIREVAELAGESQRRSSELRQHLFELEQAAAECASDHQVRRRTTFGLTAGAVVFVVFALATAATGHFVGLMALVASASLAVWAARSARAAKASAAQLAQAQSRVGEAQVELNRNEGAQDLAVRTNQDPRRLAEIEAELPVTPESADHARTLLAELESADLSAAASTHVLRQRLGARQAERESLLSGINEIKAQLDREGDPDAARQSLEIAIAAEEAALDELLPEQEGPATFAEARELAATARAARQAAAEAAAKAERQEAALANRCARQDERQALFDEAWALLHDREPEVEPTAGACRALWRTTSTAIQSLDEANLRAAAEQVQRDLAASHERQSAAAREAASVQSQLAVLSLSPQALAHGEASHNGTEDAALQAEQRELIDRAAAGKDRQRSLEDQLGLRGVTVDYAEAQETLTAFEEEIEVRKQAHRIVTLARRNIVTKVLPGTIRNMGLLLPLLTNDRYRDVDIDPDTYKIRVWDEAARAMKAKDIFSGGTRDQFSLALRLAFALATLPEELGAAPGFIFLDEPLSSFDDARTEALVNLLTRGLIASNFEQIFVISHNRTFDETLFDYHLQLEAGRVVYSDLPAPDTRPEDQQLELVAAAQ